MATEYREATFTSLTCRVYFLNKEMHQRRYRKHLFSEFETKEYIFSDESNHLGVSSEEKGHITSAIRARGLICIRSDLQTVLFH